MWVGTMNNIVLYITSQCKYSYNAVLAGMNKETKMGNSLRVTISEKVPFPIFGNLG